MSTIPKRVQIQTEAGLGKRDICLSIFFPLGCTDYASVRTETNGSTHVVIALDEPAAMREIAQMLRGAADDLVDRALGIEQPQNFRLTGAGSETNVPLCGAVDPVGSGTIHVTTPEVAK